ncbi:MAG: hypothetical protein WD577_05855 [Bacteroidales bacterium]
MKEYFYSEMLVTANALATNWEYNDAHNIVSAAIDINPKEYQGYMIRGDIRFRIDNAKCLEDYKLAEKLGCEKAFERKIK